MREAGVSRFLFGATLFREASSGGSSEGMIQSVVAMGVLEAAGVLTAVEEGGREMSTREEWQSESEGM